MNVRSSPWGEVQSADAIGPGITLISTASHGGFHLDAAARKRMPRQIARIPTFAGGPWYEEDDDATLVVLAFPELFSTWRLQAAVAHAGFRDDWKLDAFFKSAAGRSIMERLTNASDTPSPP